MDATSEARSTGRRLSPKARRAALLLAAEEVFADQGPAASFEAIAARAGVTRPLLYHYFASLDELYLACHQAARDEFATVLATAVSSAQTPEAQLRAGFRAYLRFVRERPARWKILYGPNGLASTLAEAAEIRFATADMTASLILEAAPSLGPQRAAAQGHIISGACEQFAKWWSRHPELDEDTAVDLLIDALWHGAERTLAAA